MQENQLQSLILTFVKIMNRYSALEKRAIDFGIGQKLYPSEIHTIEAIGNEEGIIARDLASAMGVTKGAISQTITKLCGKELVEKRAAELNDKEAPLFLTETGRRAYRGHIDFHRRMFDEFSDILTQVPEQQLELFGHVLEKIDNTLKGYQIKL